LGVGIQPLQADRAAEGTANVSYSETVGYKRALDGGGDGKVVTSFANPAKGFDVMVRDDNSIITAGGDRAQTRSPSKVNFDSIPALDSGSSRRGPEIRPKICKWTAF